jgi:hypothetical protein
VQEPDVVLVGVKPGGDLLGGAVPDLLGHECPVADQVRDAAGDVFVAAALDEVLLQGAEGVVPVVAAERRTRVVRAPEPLRCYGDVVRVAGRRRQAVLVGVEVRGVFRSGHQ